MRIAIARTSRFRHCISTGFVCAEKNLSISLHKLEQWGLGSVFGRIDIVTLNATVPRLGGHKKHHKQVHLHIRAIAQCYG